MSTSRDDIAVLAAGASPAHEAPALTGQLAADADLRKSYRSYLDVAGLLGFDAEATPDQFGDERKERLKARLLAAARASQQSTSAEVDYLRVVPRDLLVPFSEGVSFAVVPGENITTIYWEFDPPTCGEQALETHDQTQAGFVLDGEFTLVYPEGAARPLKRGDRYTIAPGVLHGATFQARTVLCDVYTPNHTEFEAQYALARKQREGG